MASIKKNLRQIGNSYGVILPKLILEMANINPVLDEVELYIENNAVGSIEPIMSLTTIQWLKCGNNPIDNLMPVSSLTALKKLYIENIDVDQETLVYIKDQLPDTAIVQ